jgi:hypothetical protein
MIRISYFLLRDLFGSNFFHKSLHPSPLSLDFDVILALHDAVQAGVVGPQSTGSELLFLPQNKRFTEI